MARITRPGIELNTERIFVAMRKNVRRRNLRLFEQGFREIHLHWKEAVDLNDRKLGIFTALENLPRGDRKSLQRSS